jgi:hypothetical protein
MGGCIFVLGAQFAQKLLLYLVDIVFALRALLNIWCKARPGRAAGQRWAGLGCAGLGWAGGHGAHARWAVQRAQTAQEIRFQKRARRQLQELVYRCAARRARCPRSMGGRGHSTCWYPLRFWLTVMIFAGQLLSQARAARPLARRGCRAVRCGGVRRC